MENQTQPKLKIKIKFNQNPKPEFQPARTMTSCLAKVSEENPLKIIINKSQLEQFEERVREEERRREKRKREEESVLFCATIPSQLVSPNDLAPTLPNSSLNSFNSPFIFPKKIKFISPTLKRIKQLEEEKKELESKIEEEKGKVGVKGGIEGEQTVDGIEGVGVGEMGERGVVGEHSGEPLPPNYGLLPPPFVSPNAVAIKKELKTVLNKLIKVDRNRFFFDPVPGFVEGYYQVIKKPIAFQIMKRKLELNLYESLDQFKEDVSLIVSNTILFNGEENVYADAGRELLKEANLLYSKVSLKLSNLIPMQGEGGGEGGFEMGEKKKGRKRGRPSLSSIYSSSQAGRKGRNGEQMEQLGGVRDTVREELNRMEATEREKREERGEREKREKREEREEREKREERGALGLFQMERRMHSHFHPYQPPHLLSLPSTSSPSFVAPSLLSPPPSSSLTKEEEDRKTKKLNKKYLGAFYPDFFSLLEEEVQPSLKIAHSLLFPSPSFYNQTLQPREERDSNFNEEDDGKTFKDEKRENDEKRANSFTYFPFISTQNDDTDTNEKTANMEMNEETLHSKLKPFLKEKKKRNVQQFNRMLFPAISNPSTQPLFQPLFHSPKQGRNEKEEFELFAKHYISQLSKEELLSFHSLTRASSQNSDNTNNTNNKTHSPQLSTLSESQLKDALLFIQKQASKKLSQIKVATMDTSNETLEQTAMDSRFEEHILSILNQNETTGEEKQEGNVNEEKGNEGGKERREEGEEEGVLSETQVETILKNNFLSIHFLQNQQFDRNSLLPSSSERNSSSFL